MQFNLTGKHLDISDTMREAVSTMLERLEKRYPMVSSANVILHTERHEKIADATLQVSGFADIHGSCRHEDMYHALKLLEEVLDKQLLKTKEKDK